MKLDDRDIKLINLVQNDKKYTINDILSLTKEEILLLIDLISNLIGYDKTINDIDDLGEKADRLISKLLYQLEKRKEL